MTDKFKAIMHHKVGGGGLLCSCCNRNKGKDKPVLNRYARRALARDLKREVVDL